MTSRIQSLYKTAVDMLPGNCRMHHNYATTLQNGKEREFHLREAVRLWPAYAAAWANLGVELAQTGRLSEAADTWKLGLTQGARVVGSSTGIMMSNLANALTNLGRHDEALPWWEKALRTRPKEPRNIKGLEQAKANVARKR